MTKITLRATLITLFALLFLHNRPIAQTIFLTESFADKIPDSWKTIKVKGGTAPTSNWFHTKTGSSGEFRIPPILSTTAANGWVIFDSALDCNLDGQDAWLISSPIDATTANSVWIQFQTFYRSFNDKPMIRVGENLNDLSTWAEFEVFPDILVNEFGGIIEGDESLNPQTIRIDISSAAKGKNAFYVAFQFLSDETTDNGGDLFGCAYSWQVDDVMVFEPNADHDLEILHPRGALNFVTPVDLVDTMLFLMQVKNSGFKDQTGIKYKVEVAQGGSPLFSAAENKDLLQAQKQDTVVFSDLYAPEPAQGTYSITYSVEQDSMDGNPGNNKAALDFIVHPNLLSKDDGIPASATRPNNIAGPTWQIGNYYLINKSGFVATQAQFSIFSEDSTHIGKSVNVYLYKWEEDGNPALVDAELQLVGSAVHKFVPGEGNFSLINAALIDKTTQDTGVLLQPDSEYLLMIEYAADMYCPYSELEYFWDLATLVKNNSWFLGGFGPNVTAIARLIVEKMPTNTSTTILADAAVSVHPNPTSGRLTVDLTLENTSPVVEINIKGADGKQYVHRTYHNVLREKFDFNLQHYVPGVYFLEVRTGDGVKTQRIVVH